MAAWWDWLLCIERGWRGKAEHCVFWSASSSLCIKRWAEEEGTDERDTVAVHAHRRPPYTAHTAAIEKNWFTSLLLLLCGCFGLNGWAEKGGTCAHGMSALKYLCLCAQQPFSALGAESTGSWCTVNLVHLYWFVGLWLSSLMC